MNTLLLLLLTAGSVLTAVNCSTIKDYSLTPQRVSQNELDQEPIYQPRWFGWGGGKKETENDANESLDLKGILEKVVEVFKNSEKATFQENILNLASAFGGSGTVGKVTDLLKDPNNKKYQENLIKALSDTVLSKFGGDETAKIIIETLQNPGEKTLQENLLNIAKKAALNKIGDNEALSTIADILTNPGNKTLQENLIDLATGVALSKFGDNDAVKNIANALKNSGDKTLEENLMNVATEAALGHFKDNEAAIKIVNILKDSGNKNLQETLMNVATEAALGKFGDNEAVKNIANALKTSGNKTIQENLINVATEAALGHFKDSEAVKNIANVLKNSGNHTVQETLMNVAAEAALGHFKDNEAATNIVNILKNSGNKTLQENLKNVAAEAVLSKFGDNEAVKNIANILKNSENKTMQENLLNIASEAVLGKFGQNEAVAKIVDVIRNPGNRSIAQNVANLAADLAKNHFKNNPLVKNIATILQGGNSTIQEKLSAAADTALSSTLGPVGAAVAKQGINAVGQALKLGGGFFGGFLKKIGGNSVLGKVGDAITGGTNAVGGLMSDIANGPKTAAIELAKAENIIGNIGKVEKMEIERIADSLASTEEEKTLFKDIVEEGFAVVNEVASQLENDEKAESNDQHETESASVAGKRFVHEHPDDMINSNIQETKEIPKSLVNTVLNALGNGQNNQPLPTLTRNSNYQNSFSQGKPIMSYSVNAPANYVSNINKGGNLAQTVPQLNGKAMHMEITTVKIHKAKK